MNLKLKKKKLMYMGLLGMMLVMNGCKNSSNSSDINTQVEVLNKINLKIDNTFYYKKENVYLIYDMQSAKCKEYVINNHVNQNNLVVEEIYDIQNDTVVFSDMYENGEHDIYYRFLRNNPRVVFLDDLGDYFPNKKLKDYYSIDEIRFLEPYIYNAIVNKNNETKVLVK
ncbi:MAG: hypothetical protein IJ068_03180 [Bacilli bacterium]|nr:hypothetical protein [Bacilli bacterium]